MEQSKDTRIRRMIQADVSKLVLFKFQPDLKRETETEQGKAIVACSSNLTICLIYLSPWGRPDTRPSFFDARKLRTCPTFTELTKFCVIAIVSSKFSARCHHPLGTNMSSPARTTHSNGCTFAKENLITNSYP